MARSFSVLGVPTIYFATDIASCYIERQSSWFICKWSLDQYCVFTRIVVVSIPVVPWGFALWDGPPSYPKSGGGRKKKRERKLETATKYNPVYCKTCQRKQRNVPNIARVKFSDCDEHFQQRMKKLVLIGGFYRL
jgi:hypothetical protein